LKREIETADKLLKLGGLLILDDIFFWNELQQAYESIDETKYQKLGTDARVGVLKKYLRCTCELPTITVVCVSACFTKLRLISKSIYIKGWACLWY